MAQMFCDFEHFKWLESILSYVFKYSGMHTHTNTRKKNGRLSMTLPNRLYLPMQFSLVMFFSVVVPILLWRDRTHESLCKITFRHKTVHFQWQKLFDYEYFSQAIQNERREILSNGSNNKHCTESIPHKSKKTRNDGKRNKNQQIQQ